MKSDSNFHCQIHPPFNPARVNNQGPYPEVIGAGLQNQIWGMPAILKGQMSSFVLFNESLPVEKIRELSGPGNLFDLHIIFLNTLNILLFPEKTC